MKTIGIIGCGNMGTALIKNIKAKLKGQKLFGADIDAKKRRRIQNKYRIKVFSDNRKLVKKSDVVILAVKPQDAKKVLTEISRVLAPSKLMVSIMAGVSQSYIKMILSNSVLSNSVAIVRVMPNMPALIGEGISAICAGGASRKHREEVRKIFSSIGEVVEVKEKDFDAITAISGSGPAYFFYVVEILIKSAISLGLRRDVAEKLAIKTAQGSTQLISQLKQDPQVLRKKVTSRGGTTEAAFKLFQQKSLGKVLEAGIRKARDRSRQLRGG